jgi:glycosyltransferase involved in cell wall biosynthesis
MTSIIFSLVFPCYNEEQSLPELVDSLDNAFSDIPQFEVIIVNNGSTDNTNKILKKLTENRDYINTVTVQKNIGYGHGILAGLAASKGEFLGWMHADLEYSPQSAIIALELLRSSRNSQNSIVKGLRGRRSTIDNFFTFGMGLFASLIFKVKLSDINAQPVVFSREFYHTWQAPPKDFSLDLYILAKAHLDRLNIMRLPVDRVDRKYGESSWKSKGMLPRVKLALSTAKACLNIRNNLLFYQKKEK